VTQWNEFGQTNQKQNRKNTKLTSRSTRIYISQNDYTK